MRNSSRASGLAGFSIDLWEDVSRRANITDWEFVVADDINALFESLRSGQADIAVGDLSITSSREQFVDFTHTFFTGGLAVLTRSSSLRQEIFNLIFQLETLVIMSVVVILVWLSAHVVWLMERRVNPRFPSAYVDGIWQSLWFSAVTLTTTGYGDKVPISKSGRTFGLVWMFVGVVVSGIFAGTFSSALTIAQVRDDVRKTSDLLNFVVSTVDGSSAKEFLSSAGVVTLDRRSLDEALVDLDEFRTDFLVFDSPTLRYLTSVRRPGLYRIVIDTLQPENYGFAVPAGSAQLAPINAALLSAQESGDYSSLSFVYFGSPVAEATAAAIDAANSSAALWQIVLCAVAGAVLLLNCGVYCVSHCQHIRRRRVEGDEVGEMIIDESGQKVFLAKKVTFNGEVVRMTSAEALLFDKLQRVDQILAGLSSGAIPSSAGSGGGGLGGGDIVIATTGNTLRRRSTKHTQQPQSAGVEMSSVGNADSTTALMDAPLGEPDDDDSVKDSGEEPEKEKPEDE